MASKARSRLISADALVIDRPDPSAGDGNLVERIAAEIRRSIETGVIRSGDRLPASRSLATELNVARGTIVTAFDILTAEGLLVARIGDGTYVTDAADPMQHVAPKTMKPPAPARAVPQPDVDAPAATQFDFKPCRPSLELFPVAAWRRCLSEAGLRRPSPDYGDPRGHVELRHAIADYLRRARGFDVPVDEIIVTNGAIHAMHLIASLYVGEGDGVAMEDPGYPLARQVFQTAGGEVIDIPVDENGLCVNELARLRRAVKLIYVTPSHQFPTGGRLSLDRRHALIDWATRHRVLILEDDYDGEFRYDVPPLPPLAAMSNGCVVYCGTFSKTLFPSLRIGFAIAPKEIVDNVADLRTVTEYEGGQVTQLALARFINGGEFERHVLRMRRQYASKRQVLCSAIEGCAIPGRVTGIESGINALVRLDGHQAATDICERARLVGVNVKPIRRYTHRRSAADDALVIGYGAPKIEQIERGIEALASIWQGEET